MGFFLLGRTRSDGAVRLLSDSLFDTRQQALDELSGLSVAQDLESEVFVVDLDTATPVLVVQSKGLESTPIPEPAVTPAEEPEPPAVEAEAEAEPEPVPEAEPEADEAPVEAETVPEPVETPVESETAGVWEAPVEPAIAEAVIEQAAEEATEEQPDLADALRRATGALEDSGIVAPESIRSAAAPAEPEAPKTPDAADEPPAAWPWDVAAPSESTEPEPFTLDSLEEPAADVSDLVVHPADEDVESHKPVIMGAYDEEPPAEEPPLPPAADEEIESVLADLEVVEPLAYEAGGSDIADLTCDDCVYLNTCPKRGESDPTDCGSFQWKSG